MHGDPLRDHLVAIVVPEPDSFADTVSRLYKNKVTSADFARLKHAAGDPEVLKTVLNEMNKEALSEKLKGYKYISPTFQARD